MSRRRQRAAAAAVLLLTAGILAGCNKLKAKQEIKKGHEYAKAQQYQTALASYQEALRLDPNEQKLHKAIGYAYMGMYQPGSRHAKDLEMAAKAIEHLEIYSGAYPEDRKAREVLLSLYLSTDRFDEAIAFYQQMLQENPKDTKAMGSLAAISFKKGDFDQGLSWLEKQIAVEPRAEQAETYQLIGVHAWDRSYNFPDLDPAQRGAIVERGLQALNKALEIRPDYFEAVSYINLLYREKAKLETDPLKQQEHIATADRYRARAMEMRKQAMAAQKTPTPEPAS